MGEMSVLVSMCEIVLSINSSQNTGRNQYPLLHIEGLFRKVLDIMTGMTVGVYLCVTRSTSLYGLNNTFTAYIFYLSQ